MEDRLKSGNRPRILIVGGGFGGIAAAKELRGADAEVGLVDRKNYHVFQPLLYQVATAALNPSDIASPIRRILRKQRNATVVIGEVERVDLSKQRIIINGHPVSYDYLILAAGAAHSYFGNDHWSEHAPGLKSVEDATEIRRRFLLAFERAEIETDPEARRACLTFVVVGAGPTGCELAGAMAEVARYAITQDFRRIDTKTARILLIQSGGRILKSFPEESSKSAQIQLEKLGVEVILNQRVTEVRPDGVFCGEKFIPCNNVFWAAGVKASPLGETLGVKTDRVGRVNVRSDLSVPGYSNVFVVGDQAAAIDHRTGKPVPGVAQGAMQGGTFVGRLIRNELIAGTRGIAKPQRKHFAYFDKGNLATIGKNKAVAEVAGLRFSGFSAWILWAGVHILFLVNFRSKISVALSWAYTYFLGTRGARLITGSSKFEIKKPPVIEQ